MPILRVNAVGNAVCAVGHQDRTTDLAAAVGAHPAGKPVLIMLHGYRYSPSRPHSDPHDQILRSGQDHPDARLLAWPRRMGYGPGTADDGLCVAFGWEAGGTIWRAHREAGRAGQALAALIRDLAHFGVPSVNIMAHSLGARVALSALPRLDPGMVNRMILLAGAELRSAAEAALLCPAGRQAQVLNVISRENDVYDFMYEWLLAPHRFGARALGSGLDLHHCVTTQIDHPDHLAALHRLGFPIAPASLRMCHWSGYLRPGLFPLYRAFMDEGAGLSLADLRKVLPTNLTRRWSRMFSPSLDGLPYAVP